MRKTQKNSNQLLQDKKPKEDEMAEDNEVTRKLSRRQFVKGAAAGAVGVAAVGALGACGEVATPEPCPTCPPAPTCPPEKECEACPEPEPCPPVAECVPSWLPAKWDLESDVVIVGLGGAGASAAIEAHDQGAKVLVLEKQPYGEGELAGYAHFSNSRMCGGVFHSPHPDGDRDAMVEYVKAMFSGENIPWKLEGEQPHVSDDIAKMYVEEVYKIPEWLLSIDPDLDPEPMKADGDASFPMFPKFAEAKYGSTRSIRYKEVGGGDQHLPMPKTQKSSGEAWMWALIETGIRKQRPEIDLHYNTPAKRLVQNPDTKEIFGVIAESEGKEIAIKAKKAVILAAGGLEYSVAMRRAFLEGAGVKGYGFYGSPDNRGEGIWMAMQVGAALAKPAKCASRTEPAVQAGRAWDETGLRQGLSNTYRRPGNIIVDNLGVRFIDEYLAVDSTRPYRYQSYKEFVKYDLLRMCYTRLPSWQVCDEKMRLAGRMVGGRCVETANPRLAIPWAEDNLDAIEKGWVLKGETLEELAEKLKAYPENRNMMEAETLVETITKWNEYCAAGEDLDFGRNPETMGPIDTPPFYALPLYPGGSNTKGSVDCDYTRHVLDWEYKQIPRLYSAGEMSSIFKFVYQAGGNVTECMVCGRAAGKNAAAETPWDAA